MFWEYDFTDRESVERFDSDLVGCAFVFGAGYGGISLIDAFDNYYSKYPNVFYKVLDLKLCLFNLLMSMRELERSRERRDIADIFGFHRSWFSFVITYRSFYDKFMSLIIEVGYKDELSAFDRAKSKKKKFKKIVKSHSTIYVEAVGIFIELPEEFVDWMDSFITFVDDQYRTAEVHGSGMARKWIFSENDLEQTPYKNVAGFIDNIEQFFYIVERIASGGKYVGTISSEGETS